MHHDVQDLHHFYYRTALGRVAQRLLRERLLALWPPASGQTLVGYGFAAPLFRPYLSAARRVVNLMPGPQGVMAWPAGQPNTSVLCEETAWPLPDGIADRLVLLHGLETAPSPGPVLEESARILGPGGRALFIVPARAGLWARSDLTPFGQGRPYSLRQLEGQLRAHGFTPERHVAALFIPPSERRFWLRTAPFWESWGTHRLAPWFAGGVWMVEASKLVYAPRRGGLRAAVRRPLKILEGLGAPAPVPERRLPPL